MPNIEEFEQLRNGSNWYDFVKEPTIKWKDRKLNMGLYAVSILLLSFTGITKCEGIPTQTWLIVYFYLQFFEIIC